MKRTRYLQSIQPKSSEVAKRARGENSSQNSSSNENNFLESNGIQKKNTSIPIRISRSVPVKSEEMSTNREIWNPVTGRSENQHQKPGHVRYSENIAGPSMVHDSIWNPSQLVSMNDLEQLSGEGFDDLFSYSSSPEARSPVSQHGMFRPVQMVKQQNSANPQMLPQRPQVQQLSPEHQQYVEWDQSKLQQAQKESMEPTTSQLPRENIWQKSQMITFDDIMQQSGLDEFSDLVEAEHNASLQAQGNLLKPTMILPPGQAEPTPQEPKTKDQMIDELKRIQQDFAFSKIDDFLGRYNEKEEQQQIEKQPQNEQQQTNAQMQPITADQISGMLNIQPVAGSSDMMLSLQECSQEYGEDRMNVQRKINNEAAQRSRVKKRKLIEEKLKKISVFEGENPQLKMRLDTHMKELTRLKRMLSFYVDYTKNKVNMSG